MLFEAKWEGLVAIRALKYNGNIEEELTGIMCV